MTQYFIFLPNMKAADALYIKELFKGEYFKLISTDKSWTNRQKFRVIISSKLCKSLLLLLSFPRCPKIYNVYYLTCIVLFTATFLTQTAPYFFLDPEITHPDNVRYSSSTLQSLICDSDYIKIHLSKDFGFWTWSWTSAPNQVSVSLSSIS